MRGWENIFHINGPTGKQEFQCSIEQNRLENQCQKDKEGHYLMIKGSIQEEDITIVNIYAPNIEAPRYIQQILTDIKGEIDGNTIIVGEFNTSFT